jgi:IS30 family transposase
LNWSPEQVAGWLKRAYPEDELYQVSHETIYRRHQLKAELLLRGHGAIEAAEAELQSDACRSTASREGLGTPRRYEHGAETL